MKDKVLMFIIGLLVGAIITASIFLVLEKTNKNSNQIQNGSEMQMMERPDGETPKDLPSGENPPEKPSSTESDGNRKEPLSKNKTSTDNNKTNSEAN